MLELLRDLARERLEMSARQGLVSRPEEYTN